MTKTADRVVSSAKPYVERALNDEEIRENLKKAYQAARGLIELAGKKGPGRVAKGVVDDKHVQKNLQTAVDELRTAVSRLQGRERKRRSGRMLLLVGAGAAALFNPVTGPKTRRWLKDKLSGGGDEFGYSGNSGHSDD
jgi:gas vesicle protein